MLVCLLAIAVQAFLPESAAQAVTHLQGWRRSGKISVLSECFASLDLNRPDARGVDFFEDRLAKSLGKLCWW